MAREEAPVLAGVVEASDRSLGYSRAQPLFDIARVYSDYRDDVLRYLRKVGTESAEAEDITHEVFLAALDPSAGAQKPENLFGWLITCAKRLAMRRGERSRREITAPTEMWESWQPILQHNQPSFEDALEERQQRQRVRTALRGLSARERRCLLMRSHGHSFREVAASLDIKLHQAAYHTDVAIEKLQRRLGVGL
jgi:RNA polymerase sigma factor (sigma-70 family)